MYLSLLGPRGLREVAELCCQKAHYAAEQLTANTGLNLAFDRPFFKEFVLRCPNDAAEIAQRARKAGDIGPVLNRFSTLADEFGASAKNLLLVAVTESRTKGQIDELARSIA